MSMLNVDDLLGAFRDRLDTLSGIPAASKRAYENTTFDPIGVEDEWLRETLLITDEIKSATGTIESYGEVRYGIFTPRGSGITTVNAIAKTIAEGFEEGQALQKNGLEIIIEGSARGQGRPDPDDSIWYMVPVTVLWRAFTAAAI